MKRLITLHSENLFFLFLFALLIIGFLCSSVTAENGPSPLITPSSVSGLGTMAVVNSPVPVANGGTGATTAAEALTALGGASLNGSSTVDFAASRIVAPLQTHTNLHLSGSKSISTVAAQTLCSLTLDPYSVATIDISFVGIQNDKGAGGMTKRITVYRTDAVQNVNIVASSAWGAYDARELLVYAASGVGEPTGTLTIESANAFTIDGTVTIDVQVHRGIPAIFP